MKIFLFDFDGVILDSYDYAKQEIIESVKRFSGKTISEKEFRDLSDGNFFENLSNILPQDNIEEFKEHHSKLDLREIPIFDGIDILLNELESIGELIIISSNFENKLKTYLSHHNILPHLEILGSETAISKTKKMLMVKERHPNASFVYIGDTVGDVVEAKEADISMVAVSWGHHERERLVNAQPDFIVDTVDELRSILLEKI